MRSTKSAKFEVARESLEMVPRRCPGAGASRLSRDGPVPPRSRAAGARRQLCRQTGRAKNRRGSGTGGTPGLIRTDHIVRHRGGEPPRAHRRAGSRGTGLRRQRGESSSRPAVTWQLDGGLLFFFSKCPECPEGALASFSKCPECPEGPQAFISKPQCLLFIAHD